MSDHDHGPGPTGADAIEPDETPDKFLFGLGVALTIATIVMVVGSWQYFNYVLDAELEAKGYTTENVPL